LRNQVIFSVPIGIFVHDIDKVSVFGTYVSLIITTIVIYVLPLTYMSTGLFKYIISLFNSLII